MSKKKRHNNDYQNSAAPMNMHQLRANVSHFAPPQVAAHFPFGVGNAFKFYILGGGEKRRLPFTHTVFCHAGR
ncbi:hypothetical protein POVCU2_0002640 [Plasmodium ovale curtisi]|uniref:Uncharacterized protein n=1 Tax=Plasmodium ovale curtisi TaxID=864141 RepID=A0A1A8X5E5_PLAOA|nr:hypothetical protein POVCU2_0002640 [Plasmodium ovale curtisi]SBS99408.1 hypothetical protein POVCU1_052590 [Plasmodium ovale curtisi]